MSKSSELYPVSKFAGLSTRARLSYLLPLLTACSHEELLSVQSSLNLLFFREFIPDLPPNLSLLILIKLTLKDIFACMLVSKTWCEVINSEYCTPLWRHHAMLLAPTYHRSLCDNQWKVICRNARLFQLKLCKPINYCVKQFEDDGHCHIENVKVYQLFTDENYLVVHGLANLNFCLYKDVVLVWKWEGDRGGFKYKLNILEEMDIASYPSSIETKNGSNITVSFTSNFLFILHVYIEVFNLDVLSFCSRVRLPSMSEVLGLDYSLNTDRSLKLIAIAFFDRSIYIIDPSHGVTIHEVIIEDRYPFYFSFLDGPDPRFLIYSEMGFRYFDVSSQLAPKIISDLLTIEPTNSHISVNISKNKEIVAILEIELISSIQTPKLFIFSTNSWSLLFHRELSPSYNHYNILAVGSRYVVLLGYRAKLEFIIFDLLTYEPPRSVVFKNIIATQDVYSVDSVCVLYINGWLNGEIFDEVENEGKSIPIFLVYSKSIQFSLSILSLKY
ncbi:hypothetical protein LOD99_149 [Oopsacas minuta]|uniref:F-box domain-containing protein n=1 Tax=Oopsacas minuta TaxID=111878 RepID=A0AAV7KAT6_9METZ|nr:hypothetical protein LOD99_149 [Oopsacas minuta]